MRTSGVYRRRVLSPALTDELVESVAEILDLTRPQIAADAHELGLVVAVVVRPAGDEMPARALQL